MSPAVVPRAARRGAGSRRTCFPWSARRESWSRARGDSRSSRQLYCVMAPCQHVRPAQVLPGKDGGSAMAQTAQTRSFEAVEDEAQRVFKLQRDAYTRHPYPSYDERLANLRKLDRVL